jgi:hypothetical protein
VRLSQFIISNLEEILTEWESFASTLLPGKQFDKAMLPDDAAEMLKTIAQNIETPQTEAQQAAKSKGLGPKSAQDTSAEKHCMVDWGKALTRCKYYRSSMHFAQP